MSMKRYEIKPVLFALFPGVMIRGISGGPEKCQLLRF